MPSKNNSKPTYKQQMKAIRKYVDFDYDLRQPLSSRSKGKIAQYYNEIEKLTARPNQVYRPRRKDRLEAAQNFAQHESGLKGIEVAFIPTNGNEKRKIKFDKNNNIKAVSEHVETIVLDVDASRFIDDDATDDYMNELMEQAPQAKSFTILAGAFEIPQGQSRRSLPRKIKELVNKYNKQDDDGQDANNHHKNWLHGIAAHSYKAQEDFDDYQGEKQRAKLALQNRNKNKRRRQARKNQK